MNILQINFVVFWIIIIFKDVYKNVEAYIHVCILRANGIRYCQCIDDSLHVIMNPTFVTCRKQTEISSVVVYDMKIRLSQHYHVYIDHQMLHPLIVWSMLKLKSTATVPCFVLDLCSMYTVFCANCNKVWNVFENRMSKHFSYKEHRILATVLIKLRCFVFAWNVNCILGTAG